MNFKKNIDVTSSSTSTIENVHYPEKKKFPWLVTHFHLNESRACF